MKWLALAIILIGVGVVSFPFVENQWATYKKDQYIQHFESGGGGGPPLTLENNDQIEEVNDILAAGEDNHSIFTKEEDDGSVIGTIEIPTIQLKLPILQGASDYNLKIGVGHMNGTAPIGHNGNAALAAHRGYSDGKLFNRLDEVKEGDSLLFKTKEGEFKYEVQQSFLVNPDNITVLKQSEKKKMVTLITCDPVPDPTHRLIVKAALID